MPEPLPSMTLTGIDSVAHIIQVALTPVFLLSGIGTLLNMFNLRQARVSDHAEHVFESLAAEADEDKRALLCAHLRRLWRRRIALDLAIGFGATGAAITCAAALMLFLGGMREASIASWLFALFGTALVFTVCALFAFVADTLLAWHGLRQEGPLPRPKPG